MVRKSSSKWLQAAALGLFSLSAISTTGCQVLVGGQVLPSPNYIEDDVQYFNPGPEFPLTREAAALKAFRAEQQLQNLGGAPAAPAVP